MPWLHSAEHLELVADGESQKWEPTYSDAGPANMLHLDFTDPSGGDDHPPQRPGLDRPVRATGPALPDFARFWDGSDVAGAGRRLKRFRHSSAGPLTLHSTSLLMADDPTIRIVILHPATASDAAKLERLAR